MRSILVMTLLLLVGCARMTVQVDVLSPEQVDNVFEQAELRRQYSQVMLGGDDGLVAALEENRRQVDRFFENMVLIYRRDAASFPQGSGERMALDLLADDLAEPLEPGSDFRRYYDDRFSAFREEMLAANARVRAVAAETPPRADKPITGALAETLRQRLARQREFDAFISQEARRVVEEAGDGASTSTENERQRVLRSITGGQTLEDSAFAYAVATAPTTAWATRYNRAFGSGTFGNVDLAIKLQALGDFSVKGMSFDPRKVAEVAAKVGTQSILMAAQIAGVPVSLPSSAVPSDTSGSGLTDASRDLAALQATEAARDALRRERSRALLDIAAAIAGENQTLRSTTQATRERARDAVGANYAANKARLDLTGSQ